MARKKSSAKQSPSTQEFSHSPFKRLKGLCASEEALRQPSAAQPAKTLAAAADPGGGDAQRFVEEMDSLGIKPLPGGGSDPAGTEGEARAKMKAEPPPSQQEQDQAAFLAALGGLTRTFRDEWSEDTPARQAVPRRMKQVERGQLKPEAEVDLHGLSVAEATAKVGFFLHNASSLGLRTVLIITGKGLHSNAGPVLREAVAGLLAGMPEQVLEWGAAPRRYGGAGALVVFLRGPVTG